MSGYKRVNFYELCRLCATNQQKEKTHIFTEEGRKIQLQSKIQSCLSLNVYETDFLPKVVCAKCLRSLDACYTFRQECVTSETMLSSYFKNFRYTEDFKKSGKVYIKDTTTKAAPEPVSSSTNANGMTATMINNAAFVPTIETKQQIPSGQVTQVGQSVDHIPFYTLQLPTLVTNQPPPHHQQQPPPTSHAPAAPPPDKQHLTKQEQLGPGKMMQGGPATAAPQQLAYNLNTVNLAALKTHVQQVGGAKVAVPAEAMSNVVVNANGEVINIAQLVDFESLINQAQHQQQQQQPKNSKGGKSSSGKRHKEAKSEVGGGPEETVIKIDLTEAEGPGGGGGGAPAYDTGQAATSKYDKLPHIKSAHGEKYTYAVKVDEPSKATSGAGGSSAPAATPTVIFNTVTGYQQAPVSVPVSAATYQGYGPAAGVYPTSVNIVTTSGNPSPIEQPSTVNLNVLNQNINESYTRNMSINQSSYTNVISSVSTPSQSVSSSGNHNASGNTTNNTTTINNNTIVTPKFTISQNIPLNTVHITTASSSGSSTINTTSIMSNINSSTASHHHVRSAGANHGGGGNQQQQQQAQKMHACEICQKQFKRKEHLYQHIKLHTGFRPYSCEHCNKSFMRKEHLLRHMTSHSGLKNFTCAVCEKSFSRNDNLLKHRKTHEKQSSYACDVCNKQFVMKHYYLAHKMTHEEDPCKNVCVLKAECV